MKPYTYVSLFSSAGVGCYGFKQEKFDCVLTNELVERRIEVQKCNAKCEDPRGYLCGDITDPEIQAYALSYINEYKNNKKLKDIDVVIATPPCQGMSVANHKKAKDEIIRNSLVLEAIHLISLIQPKVFIFENVAAFMNTKCGKEGQERKISEAIQEELENLYVFDSKVINFKDYGAHSSRSRCLVLGVRKDVHLSIDNLWPSKKSAPNMRDLIYFLPRLKNMGEISENDIYHNFKPYKSHMRDWIKDLKPGENAFNNLDPLKRPHQIKDGIAIPNVNKNGDKYSRQLWDKTPPCVHTRNDILASQNTVHPEDDRVFSLRELMIFMNIPKKFKWTNHTLFELNRLSDLEKKEYLKKHEVNIRQSLGEAVPTIIFSKIAKNIKNGLENAKK
ncbi:DNA cytosine methyltransferase [Acinetobacter johnsonii]|uniref:DNA cytosine methyltransferase n=1 Tax=Acinetobacter johnsonii TaxID=40214 RepID=UPI00301B5229